MLLEIYLLILALAVGSSLLAMRASVDWLTRLLGAVFGTVCWALWALQSFAIEVHSSCCVETYSYPSLAVIGGAAAAIMMLFVVKFGLSALRADPADGIETDTALDYSDR